MPTNTIAYSKPALTIAQQITLLKQRGLIINDANVCEHFLKVVGYYRLSGYWRIFQSDPVNHTYHPNIQFEQIIEQYNFDRELRLLVYDSIERIEIALRGLLVHYFSVPYGAYWFQDETLTENQNYFNANIDCIEDEIERSKEDFIRHHHNIYGIDTYPPDWKVLQILSFGTLSKIYGNLKHGLTEKKAIARAFGLPTFNFMDSWLQSLSIVRNICAHHSRLIHRHFLVRPMGLKRATHPWLTTLPANTHSFYNQICSIKYLLNQCSPGNHFTQKLLALNAKFPDVSLTPMGFIAGWEQQPLWAV